VIRRMWETPERPYCLVRSALMPNSRISTALGKLSVAWEGFVAVRDLVVTPPSSCQAWYHPTICGPHKNHNLYRRSGYGTAQAEVFNFLECFVRRELQFKDSQPKSNVAIIEGLLSRAHPVRKQRLIPSHETFDAYQSVTASPGTINMTEDRGTRLKQSR
jgi:hypothetical protein